MVRKSAQSELDKLGIFARSGLAKDSSDELSSIALNSTAANVISRSVYRARESDRSNIEDGTLVTWQQFVRAFEAPLRALILANVFLQMARSDKGKLDIRAIASLGKSDIDPLTEPLMPEFELGHPTSVNLSGRVDVALAAVIGGLGSTQHAIESTAEYFPLDHSQVRRLREVAAALSPDGDLAIVWFASELLAKMKDPMRELPQGKPLFVNGDGTVVMLPKQADTDYEEVEIYAARRCRSPRAGGRGKATRRSTRTDKSPAVLRETLSPKSGSHTITAKEIVTAFDPVAWLPPFVANEKSFFCNQVQIPNSVNKFLPFSRMSWRQGRRLRQVDYPPSLEEALSNDKLIELRSQLNVDDLSIQARIKRMKIDDVLRARALTRAVRSFGSLERYIESAKAERERCLLAIDAGAPLRANEIIEMTARVPNCLVALGHAIPSREAIDLASQFDPLLELGAGVGLCARALLQAGSWIASTDLATEGAIGLACPTYCGVPALEAMERFPEASLLVTWPEFTDPWIVDVFKCVKPGQTILMASPEFEFWLRGGITTAHWESDIYATGNKLYRIVCQSFEEIASAALPSDAPGDLDIRLRAWRRFDSAPMPALGS